MINIASVTDEKITYMDGHHGCNPLIGLWTQPFPREYCRITSYLSLLGIANDVSEKDVEKQI